MEQLRGQVRDGQEVLYDGPVYLANFKVAGVESWCGLVSAPAGTFPPGRPTLALHLADGRSARIELVGSTTSSGRFMNVHFDVVGPWSQSAG